MPSSSTRMASRAVPHLREALMSRSTSAPTTCSTRARSRTSLCSSPTGRIRASRTRPAYWLAPTGEIRVMNIARRVFGLRGLLLALAAFAAMLPGIAQAITYRITIDTRTMAAQPTPPAPFSLEFQLIGGDPGAANTVVISNFDFGAGGRPRGTPTLTGGATGDLSGAVILTDGQFLNEFVQEFTPSARDPLTFTVDLTDSFAGPIPDSFSIGILDRSGSGLPTEFFDAFVQIDINASPAKKSFAGDPSAPPPGCPDCAPVSIAAPAVNTGVEACPADVTHQVVVAAGPVRSAGVSGRFLQQVRITNQSTETMD